VSIDVREVTMFRVRKELVREFETSSHRKSSIEHVIIKVTADDGRIGWGESASPADPFYCYESTDTCWHVLERYLIPHLLNHTFASPSEALATSPVTGHPFAHAASDVALWDLDAQAHDQPLADYLGGTQREVTAGVSLGIEKSIDDLLAVVAHHVADGYQRVKLKISPTWHVEPTRAVREAFPAVAVQVDANGAFTSGDLNSPVFRALDQLGLLMIEQPFGAEDLLSHATLQGQLDTPLCLDESITSLDVLRTALQLHAARVINIKVSRLGGVGPARDVHDLCFDAGIPVWCGGMHEFGVGRAANLAVASLPGFTYPSDLSGSSKYYATDLVEPVITATHGQVTVPRYRSGLGLTVLEERVRHDALESITFHAPKQ
jgi:O-succinylbenzoate synthase